MNEEEARDIVNILKNSVANISNIKESQRTGKPPKPFKTTLKMLVMSKMFVTTLKIRVTKWNRKRWQMDFVSIFDRCAEAPKCVSHWFLHGFVDVGCFAHGAFTAWKNFEKNN